MKESVFKNMSSNLVPPLKSVKETNDNTHWFAIASFILLGLLTGSLVSTIIYNTLEYKKTKKEVEEANGTAK